MPLEIYWTLNDRTWIPFLPRLSCISMLILWLPLGKLAGSMIKPSEVGFAISKSRSVISNLNAPYVALNVSGRIVAGGSDENRKCTFAGDLIEILKSGEITSMFGLPIELEPGVRSSVFNASKVALDEFGLFIDCCISSALMIIGCPKVCPIMQAKKNAVDACRKWFFIMNGPLFKGLFN